MIDIRLRITAADGRTLEVVAQQLKEDDARGDGPEATPHPLTRAVFTGLFIVGAPATFHQGDQVTAQVTLKGKTLDRQHLDHAVIRQAVVDEVGPDTLALWVAPEESQPTA